MSVAKSYAQALYESAIEAKSSPADLDQVEQQMDAYIASVAASRDADIALNSPSTTAAEKVLVVEAFSKNLEFRPLLTQFFSLMARKGRLPIVREIRAAFREVRLTAEGGMLGTLVAADPLSDTDA